MAADRRGPASRANARTPVRRLLTRVLTAGLVLALTVGVIAVFLPQSTPGQWLSTRLLFAQVLAFPGLAGAGLVLLGLGVPALGQRARARAQAGAVVVAVMFALLGTGLLFWPDGPPWAAGPSTATANAGREVRVTVFNSLDTLTAADVQHLIAVANPDVLVLPEASPARVRTAVVGTAFAQGVHEGDDAGFSRGRPAGVAPTAIAMHSRMGSHRPAVPTPMTFGTVALEPAGTLEGPLIVGVHTAPPLPRLMDSWRADLSRLQEMDRAAAEGPMIVAGDLNATLRHGPLAARTHLADTARQCPGSAEGTWPASAPPWVRAPIDHVLVTDDVQVLSCGTVQVGASDHLAYSVELRLP